MNTKRHVYRADEGFVWRKVGDEIVLLSRDSKWLHILNEVGSEIWKFIDGSDGSVTVEDIVSHICSEFEVERETAEMDTLEFIEKLSQKGILVVGRK